MTYCHATADLNRYLRNQDAAESFETAMTDTDFVAEQLAKARKSDKIDVDAYLAEILTGAIGDTPKDIVDAVNNLREKVRNFAWRNA